MCTIINNYIPFLEDSYDCLPLRPTTLKSFEHFMELPTEIIAIIISKVSLQQNAVKKFLNLRRVSRLTKYFAEREMEKSGTLVQKWAIGIKASSSTKHRKIRLTNSRCFPYVDLYPNQLRSLLKLVKLSSRKQLFIHSPETNPYLLTKIIYILLDFIKDMKNFNLQPQELIITGSMQKISPRLMLDYLRLNPTIQKMHFQEVTISSNFFSDAFLNVLPNMTGFLLNLHKQCNQQSPHVNFTIEGLTKALNNSLEYIYLPYLDDVINVSEFHQFINQYFIMCDKLKESERLATIISIGYASSGIERISKEIFNIKNEKQTQIAYQVNREMIEGGFKPVLYHSMNCKGTLLLNCHKTPTNYYASINRGHFLSYEPLLRNNDRNYDLFSVKSILNTMQFR